MKTTWPADFGINTAPGEIACVLCARQCVLKDGENGFCRVRGVWGGQLVTFSGNAVSASHVDPVEKKPLYHFLPGCKTFSIGTLGCNFDCAWCQNDSISRDFHDGAHLRHVTSKEVVQAALAAGCKAIAYTYNEPTLLCELISKCSAEASSYGLKNILVSNGYQNRQSIGFFLDRMDAANIDLKTFRDATSRRFCGVPLKPVLDNLRLFARSSVWLEVTTLIIPGINDSPAELNDIASFIAGELGPSTPWHISAFFPARHMSEALPTSTDTIRAAAEIGKSAGLQFIYPGNTFLPGTTFCPSCGSPLIERKGYNAVRAKGFNGVCPACGKSIPGVWDPPTEET